MADDLKTQYVVEVLKQGEGAAQAERDLNQLNATKQKSIGIATQLGNAYRFLAGSIIAGVLIREIRASIRAFGEQEIAVAKLNGTLRASGQFTEEYSKELQTLASSLQNVSRFGDETILDVSRQLIAFGAARGEVAVLTEAVLDLAEGMGTDLSAAALLLGKALSGEFSTLSRYGILVDQNATQTEKLNQALKQIEERFGGLARGAADTATGKIQQLTNAFGDLREEIGAIVAIEGGPLVQWLIQITQELTKIIQLVRETSEINPKVLAEKILGDAASDYAGQLFRGQPAVGGGASDANAQEEALKRITAAVDAANKEIERGLSLEDQRVLLVQRQGEAYRQLDQDLQTVNATNEQIAATLRLQNEAHAQQRDEIHNLIALEEHRAKMSTDANQLLLYGVEQFSYGMSNALVNVAQDFDNAGEHIKEFFGQFLAQIGQAILQTIILRSVMGAFGLNAPASVGTGVTAGAGAMTPRAYAMGGVATVNGPTVLPRFNALVGEAGPEFLTVLRAPKMLNLGGMLAASGYIGNTGLGLVNTQALQSKFAEGGVAGQLPRQFSGLASGGQGGSTEVVIRLSSGLRGEIVAESINGARVKIAQDMGDDSDVSRATKRLVA